MMICPVYRNWKVKDRRSRETLLRTYVELQIYLRWGNEWVKNILPPTFFCIGGAVVLLLYIPLAHSESFPGLLSAGFAYVAMDLVAIVFWVCTDCLAVTRNTEDILISLQSKPEAAWRLDGQVELLKRAKAVRPVLHPIGNFGSITLGVLVVFTEEILNQLLFLLSL